MISYSNDSGRLENRIVTRFRDTLSGLVVELLAFKNNTASYKLDEGAINRLFGLVSELQKESVSRFDEPAMLLGLIKESKSFSEILEKQTEPQKFLSAVQKMSNVDQLVSDVETINEKLRARVWSGNSDSRLALFSHGAN